MGWGQPRRVCSGSGLHGAGAGKVMLGRRAHRPLCLRACACTKAAVDMRLQTAASWCCPPNSRLPPPPLQHVDTQHHNACRAHAVPPRPSAGAGGGCTRQAPGHSRSRWAGAEHGGLGAGGDGGSPTTGLSCRLPRGSELPRRRCGLRHWRKLPVAPCGARCWVAPPTCSSLQPPQSLPSTLPLPPHTCTAWPPRRSRCGMCACSGSCTPTTPLPLWSGLTSASVGCWPWGTAGGCR